MFCLNLIRFSINIFMILKKVEHELKPGGKDIKVTNDNKKEFI